MNKATKYFLGKRVYVYRNLRKNLYSVLYRGKVIDHTSNICLRDVKFVVREAGRQRVLREKRKNVHAFVVGTVIKECIIDYPELVYYNPYKHNSFIRIYRKLPITNANFVILKMENFEGSMLPIIMAEIN